MKAYVPKPGPDEVLRLTTERFQVALKNSPVAVFNQDRDLRYTWIYNPALGYRPEDVIGKRDRDIFEREEDARLLTGIKTRVMETGLGERQEVLVRYQGMDLYFDLTVEPLRDAAGRIDGVTCAAVDVTRSKAVEQELRQSKDDVARERRAQAGVLARHARRQALLLEVVSSMLQVEFDEVALARLIFARVGEQLEADLGFNYRFDPASGELNLIACFGAPPEMASHIRRLGPGHAFCGQVAASGQAVCADAGRIERDDKAAVLRRLGVHAYTCHPLFARDGQVLGTLSMGSRKRRGFDQEETDFLQTLSYFLSLAWEKGLAEREVLRLNAVLERRVEERTAELGRANEALLKSNQDLQQFAHVAAHDMQTPLRSIAGFAQLLLKDYGERLDPGADQYIHQVVENTRRLQLLITDLLAYSRLDSQARPLESTDLNRVFEEVAASLGQTIREAGAEVTRDELPTLLGDRIQIAQVLQNLIENGIKYNRAGVPRVHVSAERRDGEWLLSVRDNGIGIPDKHRERIFGLFRRLHTYQEYPGSGIGLAICHRIVERYGGRIWVESAPGQGSVFYFTLPAGDRPVMP